MSNGATGTATVDLRGLGSARTLVLVDGRRMPYGGVTNSAADLNQIPARMVERVEVLTGGASAVYGSDAIAGVVNFIMKKDFEGVQFDAQYGFYQHNNRLRRPDGAVKLRDVIAGRAATNPSQFGLPDNNVTDGDGTEVNVLMGVSTEDGRGNITAYAGVRNNDEVLQRDRDFSACSLGRDRQRRRVYVRAAAARARRSPARSRTSRTYSFTSIRPTGNTFRTVQCQRWTSTTSVRSNHYQRPDRRYSLGALGHYELTEQRRRLHAVDVHGLSSIAQIAPGGNFFDSNSINCDNPLLSAQQLGAAFGCTAAPIVRRAARCRCTSPAATSKAAAASRTFDNSSFRGVLGVRGAITEQLELRRFGASSRASRPTSGP